MTSCGSQISYWDIMVSDTNEACRWTFTYGFIDPSICCHAGNRPDGKAIEALCLTWKKACAHKHLMSVYLDMTGGGWQHYGISFLLL